LTALDIYYDGVMAVDDLLAKALRLSEVARIARLETQLRRYLLAKWNAHAKKAVREASVLAAQLKPASQIAKAVEKEMDKWTKEVLPRHIETQQKIYRLARTAGWKKANKKTRASLAYSTENLTEVVTKAEPVYSEILPAFDIADERAMEALGEHQTFWIGEHYDENIGSTIADTTKTTMVEAGTNRRVAGELIRERVAVALGVFSTPAGWHGSAAQYFEGVAANAATTARAFGQMRSFQDYGVVKYEWNANVDKRTCTRCAHLDGRVFTVEQGVGAMGRELRATTPAGVKRAHPFIGGSAADMTRLLSLAPTKGRGPMKESASLAGAGISMPPLHFRCRCTVDISTEIGSWEI